MKRRVVLLCAAFLVLALAFPVSASNMGVALRMQLTSTPEPLHFISLPYIYTPGTAEALCQDLGNSGGVSGILRWDDATSAFVEYSCGSGAGEFTLEGGTGYGVRVDRYFGNNFIPGSKYSKRYGLGFFFAQDLLNNVEVIRIPPNEIVDDDFSVLISAETLGGVGVPGLDGGAFNQDFAIYIVNAQPAGGGQ